MSHFSPLSKEKPPPISYYLSHKALKKSQLLWIKLVSDKSQIDFIMCGM